MIITIISVDSLILLIPSKEIIMIIMTISFQSRFSFSHFNFSSFIFHFLISQSLFFIFHFSFFIFFANALAFFHEHRVFERQPLMIKSLFLSFSLAKRFLIISYFHSPSNGRSCIFERNCRNSRNYSSIIIMERNSHNYP